MRHRRRCQGPIKPQNRRKACDACVAAKTRCSYEQPTCARCTKRGTPCIYASKPESRASTESMSNDYAYDSAMDTSEPSDTSGTPTSTTGPTFDPRTSFSLVTTTEPLELPLWDTTIDASWSWESYNLSLQSTCQDPVSLLNWATNTSTDNTMNSDLGVMADFSFSHSGDVTGLHSPVSAGVLPPSPVSWNLPYPTSKAPFASDMITSSSVTSLDVVRILADYPAKLLSAKFVSPFLHRSLYKDSVPDMTALPSTSVAICCGSGMEARNSRQFARRVIDTERRRLIDAFVSMRKLEVLYLQGQSTLHRRTLHLEQSNTNFRIAVVQMSAEMGCSSRHVTL